MVPANRGAFGRPFSVRDAAMTNPSPQELRAIHAQRARTFTPRWFAALFGGRLGVGETFWMGNLGVAMVVVPVALLILMLLLKSDATGAAGMFTSELFLGLGLYRAALLRGLWKSFRASPLKDGWGWTGLAATAAIMATELGYGLRGLIG